MNFDSLNKPLTLIANLGVLIGLIVVIFELRQTQTNMMAESSTMRAQMMSENASILAENRIVELQMKLANEQQLTPEELRGAREWLDRMLRHFENLHYQNGIGVLNEEIWETNSRSMRGLRRSELFNAVYTNWPNGIVASFYRDSFVAFIDSEN